MLSVLFLLTLLACGETKQDASKETRESPTVMAPKQIISINTAREHYGNYSERRVPLIQKYEDSILASQDVDSSFVVARYVSFDYATLKEYMAYIEQEAGKVDAEISSLRFYLANNPEKGPYVHPRQNSVFLVPAAKPGNEGDFEYGLYIDGDRPGFLSWNLDPFKSTDGQGGSQEKSEAAIFPLPNAASYAEQSLILNFGGASPPPYQ